MAWERPPRGRGGRVKTRTAPNPYQALGLGGPPATARAARVPRPTEQLSRKTLPHCRISRTAGVHHRKAKV